MKRRVEKKWRNRLEANIERAIRDRRNYHGRCTILATLRGLLQTPLFQNERMRRNAIAMTGYTREEVEGTAYEGVSVILDHAFCEAGLCFLCNQERVAVLDRETSRWVR